MTALTWPLSSRSSTSTSTGRSQPVVRHTNHWLNDQILTPYSPRSPRGHDRIWIYPDATCCWYTLSDQLDADIEIPDTRTDIRRSNKVEKDTYPLRYPLRSAGSDQRVSKPLNYLIPINLSDPLTHTIHVPSLCILYWHNLESSSSISTPHPSTKDHSSRR